MRGCPLRMTRLKATLFLALLLAATGCAVFEPSDSLEAEAATLSTPDMDAAIKAAKPGEPRKAS